MTHVENVQRRVVKRLPFVPVHFTTASVHTDKQLLNLAKLVEGRYNIN